MTEWPSLLTLDGVSKAFGGAAALRDVSIDVRAGEVHALVSMNGAGKSTLVGVMSGVHAPDAGTISIDGAPIGRLTPRRAREAGIAIVPQHRTLVPQLSVAENLFLGFLPRRARAIDWRRLESEARAALVAAGLDVDPRDEAGRLSVAEQTMVEIAREVGRGGRLIIMDEPTASLGGSDAEAVRDLVKRLAAQAGVPMYLVAIMPENVEDVLGASVVDLAGVGGLAAGWIEEDAAGEAAEVAIVAGAPGASSDYVVAGFREALPGSAEVVAEQPGMFNRGAAQSAAEDILQASPEVDYIFVLNEDMAFGVRTAIDAAGSDAQIVTTNGTDPGLEAIESGDFSATVADSALHLGIDSFEQALALLDDPDGEKIYQKPVQLITADNVAEAPEFCGDVS